jgi:hypothetical protein
MDVTSTHVTERPVHRLGETLVRCGGFSVVYLPTPEDRSLESFGLFER